MSDQVGFASELSTSEAAEEAAVACASGPVSAFDDLIREVQVLADAASARSVAMAEIDGACCSYGEGAGGGVVMRRDIGIELGGGNAATCAMVLTTSDGDLVRDGRVSVIGPDFDEVEEGAVLPFAQMVLIGGSSLTGADVQALEEIQKVRNWVHGYQVRTTTNEIAARVSKELKAAGFTLGHLGKALAALARSAHPEAAKVEVVFVTASSDEVKALRPLANRWVDRSREIRRCAMAEIGIDIDCPSGGHCGKCKDKDTCDQVRRIQAMRRTAKRAGAI